ncbi:MarR family transcriptional regulator [Oceanobacillus piezotolerans]|uniref:MarR family transcriptional regulator n=1 Tax=Oceanobacillus piezotolerans TaxID=2448030 RepID=A0A498D738_9BACI|nr:MarR family transcriptional regulator [Oceanobacillus piezotolerans]RLL45479.1 MarR family transcriptional regulator [Oceanobacillus piezotolerans]
MLNRYLEECLYFTASRLTRVVTKMAEEEFSRTGLAPTYAFLMMAVLDKEGITQKELGEILHLQPSTVTRLIEKLVNKRLIEKQADGRSTRIFSTEKGKEREASIYESWKNLRASYNEILGEKEGDELTLQLSRISEQLEKMK